MTPAPPGSRVDVAWRIVDREAYIVDVTTGHYFSLNPVGTEIWERLQRGETVTHIAAALGERYHRSSEEVAEDVAAYVAELRQEGLIDRDQT